MEHDDFSFVSARSKLARAAKHRSELQSILREFIQARPLSAVIERDKANDRQVIRLVLSRDFAMNEFSVVVGDCLHNLRSAVDHAIWELVTSVGVVRQTRDISFPSGRTRADFTAACDKLFKVDKTKGLCVWLQRKLKEYEIYEGGIGGDLYLLMLANNLDKHRWLLLSVIGSEIPSIDVVFADGSRNKSIGNRLIGAPFPITLDVLPDTARVTVGSVNHETINVHLMDFYFPIPPPVISTLLQWEGAVAQVLFGLEHLAFASRSIKLPDDYRLRAFGLQ